MVLHALSFGALLILGVTYCAIQNKQQVTGRLMKELRGQSGEYYPISKNRDEKGIRSHPNCSNSNNNNKADTDLDLSENGGSWPHSEVKWWQMAIIMCRFTPCCWSKNS